jgi:hypothetical protein
MYVFTRRLQYNLWTSHTDIAVSILRAPFSTADACVNQGPVWPHLTFTTACYEQVHDTVNSWCQRLTICTHCSSVTVIFPLDRSVHLHHDIHRRMSDNSVELDVYIPVLHFTCYGIWVVNLAWYGDNYHNCSGSGAIIYKILKQQ